MDLNERIAALAAWGQAIENIDDSELERLSSLARSFNGWFDQANVKHAIRGISSMLKEEKLLEWTSRYDLTNELKNEKIGLILAGNIPFVGFHDVLSVLLAGYKMKVKLSSQDEVIPNYLVNELHHISPVLAKQIVSHDRMDGVDAIIATGSNNSFRYFEHYFGKLPHIIRKNRNSVGIITGDESAEELALFGKDIFQYYGLGCRNVSKLYLSEKADPVKFLDAMEPNAYVMDNHKYANNYEYQRSAYLINQVSHLDTGYMLLREAEEMISPVGVVYYERYKDINELKSILSAKDDQIQCIVSTLGLGSRAVLPGQAQMPEPWDYADGVDTLEFLQKLS
ncbi:MAG: acyl-CoA reductase [Cyclobacteriaceae bacterium]|nr:acyl-CoA reductase [Cyclobacteriaceae bacterium]MCH8517088.1 acyl-CoA reductase [Cyclobacteriaceae bacterium]